MTFAPGTVVSGRYELGRQLGAGGMARVYVAHDRLLDREVAVKVLAEPYASDPQFVERFRREASAAAQLNHPNIVAVYDRGEVDGSYYIVMEYLPGPDLKQVIRRRAPLPPGQAIDYALQILAALGAAHRRDVIHRDVKPQNVLVAEDGHLKVTDFGIARAGADGGMTEAGAVIGTAQYLSPEQARGDDVTTASDCYAVGIVLYEMLTGRVPFDGDRPVAVAMKQISDVPAPPRTVEPSIPLELDAVVMRALAKRPSERFRTAEEFSGALLDARGAIEGTGGATRVLPAPGEELTEPTRAMAATGTTRVGPPPPHEPPRRRRRWPLVVGLLVLLAALAAGAFAFLGDGDGGAETFALPDVTGQELARAQQTLEQLGLSTSVERVEDEEAEPGTVVGTSPPPGSEVREGDTVTLRVSEGPGARPVPDVVGRTEDEARRVLVQAGFQVAVQREASEDEPAGRVLAQAPAAGTEAEPDSTVTITVSSGPEQVVVPDVRRRSVTSAEAQLRSAGLRISVVSSEPNDDFPPDTVLRQDPGPTARVDRGSTVEVVVSAPLPNVTVPDVIGNTAQEARRKLENAGFTVTSNTATSPEPAGIVIDQSPAAGTSVQPGRPVNITVSDGPGTGNGGAAPPAPTGDAGGGRGPDGTGPPGQRGRGGPGPG